MNKRILQWARLIPLAVFFFAVESVSADEVYLSDGTVLCRVWTEIKGNAVVVTAEGTTRRIPVSRVKKIRIGGLRIESDHCRAVNSPPARPTAKVREPAFPEHSTGETCSGWSGAALSLLPLWSCLFVNGDWRAAAAMGLLEGIGLYNLSVWRKPSDPRAQPADTLQVFERLSIISAIRFRSPPTQFQTDWANLLTNDQLIALALGSVRHPLGGSANPLLLRDRYISAGNLRRRRREVQGAYIILQMLDAAGVYFLSRSTGRGTELIPRLSVDFSRRTRVWARWTFALGVETDAAN